MTRPTWDFETSLGTDPLAPPVWADQPYVRAIDVTAGRQQELDVFQPGEATVRLYNRDRRFDPYNADGPHYGSLLPRRRCRLRARIDRNHGGTGFDGTVGRYWHATGVPNILQTSGSLATIGHGGTGFDGVTTGQRWTSGIHANLNTATSVEVIAYVSADDWTPGAARGICAGASTYWNFGINAANRLYLRVLRASDFVALSSQSSAAPTVSDGDGMWIRAEWVAGAQTRYYTSNDPASTSRASVTWTQLGSDVAVPNTGTPAFTNVTGLGGTNSIASIGMWDGAIFKCWAAFSGSTIFDVDFANHTHGATSITDDAGVSWTATGTNVSVHRSVGTVTYITCLALDDWTTAAAMTVGGWWGSAGGSGVSMLSIHPLGQPRFYATGSHYATCAAAPSVADGEAVWIAARCDAARGRVTFYESLNAPFDHPGYDVTGGDWTVLGAAAGSSVTSSWDQIWQSSSSNASIADDWGAVPPFIGRIYSCAGLLNDSVQWDLQFANEAHGATSVTDEQGFTWTATGTGVEVISEEHATYDVFTGFSQGWPVADGDLGASPTDLVDAFELLSATPLAATPLEQTIINLRPVHWWKLNDPQGGNEIFDAGTSSAHGTPRGQAQDGLGADTLDAFGDSTSVDLDGGYLDITGSIEWTSLLFLARYDGESLYLNSPFVYGSDHTMVRLAADGALSVWDATAGTDSTTGHFADTGDRDPHLVLIVRAAPGDFTIYIDGTDATGSTEPAADLLDTYQQVLGTRSSTDDPLNFFDGALAHVAMWDTALTAQDAADLHDAWRAWDGDTTGERVDRILDLLGWPTADRDIDTGEVTLGPVTDWGSDALEMLRTLEATEGGALYQTPAGDIRFRSRYSHLTDTRATTPQATFSDDPDTTDAVRYHNPAVPGQLTWIRNQVTVTWVGGQITVIDQDSIDAYGPVSHEVRTVLATAAEARRLGEWILAHYAQPQLRISQLDVDLAAEPQHWATVLGLRHGDRVTVEWTPAGVGDPIEADALVEFIAITAGDGTAEATATIGLSAAETIEFWTWGTSTWGETTTWA